MRVHTPLKDRLALPGSPCLDFLLPPDFRRNILPNITTSYLKSCIYDARTDPFCPIFRLGKIVEDAGHSFQDMAVEVGASLFTHLLGPSTDLSSENLAVCPSCFPNREASWASRSSGTATLTEPPPSACPGIPSGALTPGTWSTTCLLATTSGV